MSRASKREHQARMSEIHKQAQAILAAGGKCPKCGAPLKRNLALTGWWQCVRFGRDDFRPQEYRGTGDCEFQMFTE